ncbi:MAG: hypothetical protein Q7S16_03155 [bacterium]|nr:hypothetical protein [bacterium]
MKSEDISNGTFRLLMILTVIIFAGALFMSNRKVKELDQKVAVLQSETRSLKMEILKNWGKSSLIAMSSVVMNADYANLWGSTITNLHADLHNAITIETTFVICNQIAHELKMASDLKGFEQISRILNQQIDEYKRIVGMPTVHPNSNL